MFFDVECILMAHIVCIAAAWLRPCFPSTTTAGQFWRNTLNHVKIWTYLLSLFFVTMSNGQQDLRPTQDQSQLHNCPGIAEMLDGLRDFRRTEMVVFASQIAGLCSYVIISKIFLALKKRVAGGQEVQRLRNGDDPYWRLVLTQDSLSDFLEHEGYTASSLVLLFTNLYVMLVSCFWLFVDIMKVQAYS